MKLNKPILEGQVRDVNDKYETPRREANIALRHIQQYMLDRPKCTILEPACGSGRIVRAAHLLNMKCFGYDLEETGDDFLKRKGTWAGPIVTNPPYRDGLALRFVEKALEVADGPVAMLLQGGFLWGEERSELLRGPLKPDAVIVIPWRVYFYKRDGSRIKGQAYNNMWVFWPERKSRPYTWDTKLLIAGE